MLRFRNTQSFAYLMKKFKKDIYISCLTKSLSGNELEKKTHKPLTVGSLVGL